MIITKWYFGNDNLIDAYTIRSKVFIQEQNVPEEIEMDNQDEHAYHIVVYDNQKAIATGRLIFENGEYIIGRVAVLKEHRKNGYGNLIVKMLIRKAFELGAKKIKIHAQINAKKFYETLGFKAIGEKYIEAGTEIEHIDMIVDRLIDCQCN